MRGHPTWIVVLVVVLNSILAVLVLALGVFAAFYGMVVTAVWCLLALAALVLVPLLAHRLGWIRYLVGGLVLVLGVVLAPPSIDQMSAHTGMLMARIRESGAESLVWREKAGVYVLGLWMAVAGSVQYPEVARETLGLYSEASSGSRVYESPFAMRSARIRERIEGFRDSLPAQGSERQPIAMEVTRLPWSDYELDKSERRVALALNPCLLDAAATWSEDGWVITARARVLVRFPSDSRTVLGTLFGRELVIEEGLFWALQECGWLHPYEAVWTWTLPG
jgi:hypothetical protein